MKKLLLLLLFILSVKNLQAQGTCATAIDVSTNGTFIAPTYDGTYQVICLSSRTGIKASWYKYIATADGEVTISSDLPTNDGIVYTNDTRISILKGTCGTNTLTCFDFSDNISPTNFLTTLTFPVAAGTTYFIQWDNNNKVVNPATPASLLGFEFSVSFVAGGCVRPNNLGNFLPNNVTTTSQTITYQTAVGAPANYDVDWSNNFSAPAGSGTLVTGTAGTNPTAFFVPLLALPSESNFRYFVRSNCGAGSTSAWQGPKLGFLAKTLPYVLNFEDGTKFYTDGFTGFVRYTSTATSIPTGMADSSDGFGNSVFTSSSTTTISNRRGYTRGISLVAGEVVTFDFKTKLFPSTGTPMTFNLTVGNNQTAAAQTIVIANFTENNGSVFTPRTANWTAPTTGVYFFSIHNNSPIATVVANLYIDSISITSTILATDNFLNNSFSVSPNPASKLIKISNMDNINVNEINITDLNGRIVKSEKVNTISSLEINIEGLTSGLYLLNMNTDKGTVTKKIIKN